MGCLIGVRVEIQIDEYLNDGLKKMRMSLKLMKVKIKVKSKYNCLSVSVASECFFIVKFSDVILCGFDKECLRKL